MTENEIKNIENLVRTQRLDHMEIHLESAISEIEAGEWEDAILDLESIQHLVARALKDAQNQLISVLN